MSWSQDELCLINTVLNDTTQIVSTTPHKNKTPYYPQLIKPKNKDNIILPHIFFNWDEMN